MAQPSPAGSPASSPNAGPYRGINPAIRGGIGGYPNTGYNPALRGPALPGSVTVTVQVDPNAFQGGPQQPRGGMINPLMGNPRGGGMVNPANPNPLNPGFRGSPNTGLAASAPTPRAVVPGPLSPNPLGTVTPRAGIGAPNPNPLAPTAFYPNPNLTPNPLAPAVVPSGGISAPNPAVTSNPLAPTAFSPNPTLSAPVTNPNPNPNPVTPAVTPSPMINPLGTTTPGYSPALRGGMGLTPSPSSGSLVTPSNPTLASNPGFTTPTSTINPLGTPSGPRGGHPLFVPGGVRGTPPPGSNPLSYSSPAGLYSGGASTPGGFNSGMNRPGVNPNPLAVRGTVPMASPTGTTFHYRGGLPGSPMSYPLATTKPVGTYGTVGAPVGTVGAMSPIGVMSPKPQVLPPATVPEPVNPVRAEVEEEEKPTYYEDDGFVDYNPYADEYNSAVTPVAVPPPAAISTQPTTIQQQPQTQVQTPQSTPAVVSTPSTPVQNSTPTASPAASKKEAPASSASGSSGNGNGKNLYKLVIVGGGGVGKSALTIQFIQSMFVEEYDPTIEDSYRKQVTIDSITTLIDLLDTAGQEEYATMRDTYLRGGEGFLLTYSITSRQSYEEAQALHKQILLLKEADNWPCVLVANKADLETQRVVPESEARALANSWKVPFFETSAFNRQNVDECFFELVRECRRYDSKSEPVGGASTKTKRPARGSALTKNCTLF